MSSESSYSDLHAWVLVMRQTAQYKAWPQSEQITDRDERLALAIRAREAVRYLTALADRLELFDA